MEYVRVGGRENLREVHVKGGDYCWPDRVENKVKISVGTLLTVPIF